MLFGGIYRGATDKKTIVNGDVQYSYYDKFDVRW